MIRGAREGVLVDTLQGFYRAPIGEGDIREVERIEGGRGDDTMRGGPGAETFLGGGGADELFGRSGDDVHCTASAFPGIDTHGGYAEYLRTSARSVVKLDPSLQPADVAALADAGLTAYHAAAKASRRLGPRDTCVVIGAGGLGHIGLQVLKALTPARLVVLDRNPDAVKLALEIGADDGIVADGGQVEEVLSLTGGNGAEAVIDFVGEGGSTAQGLAMTRRAGDYHVVGYGENVDVPTIDLISAEVNVVGNLVGSYNDLCDLMELAARGRVTLHTSTYALDDFQSALDDLDAGTVRGRAILVP